MKIMLNSDLASIQRFVVFTASGIVLQEGES